MREISKPLVLNLIAGVETEDGRDGWGGDTSVDVTVLYCNGIEVWRDKDQKYVDVWGDGGDRSDDIVADMLRKVFSAV